MRIMSIMHIMRIISIMRIMQIISLRDIMIEGERENHATDYTMEMKRSESEKLNSYGSMQIKLGHRVRKVVWGKKLKII
jgi:hypothetical protein